MDQLAGPPTVWRHWFCDSEEKAATAPTAPGDCGPMEGVAYRCGGDEHGILEGPGLAQGGGEGRSQIRVGDRVLLQPSHCDPTVNLHSQFVFCGRRPGGGAAIELEPAVPIWARGPGC